MSVMNVRPVWEILEMKRPANNFSGWGRAFEGWPVSPRGYLPAKSELAKLTMIHAHNMTLFMILHGKELIHG